MAQISVDTKLDSSATLQHLITLLQEELRMRGSDPSQPYQPSRPQPLQVSTPSSGGDLFSGNSNQNPGIQTDASSHPFGSMFGNDNPVQTSQTQQPISSPAPDMFSVFSHDAPSSQTHSLETASSINDNMNTSGYDSPSASALLSEDDVEDKSEHVLHHAADLAEEVLRSGSTRKPESPFKLEPYE